MIILELKNIYINMLGRNAGEIQSSISKFERMLKTNLIYYFDPQEFEDIVVHYLGYGENQIAKKALKENISLKESAKVLGYLSEQEFDNIVKPELMVSPKKA